MRDDRLEMATEKRECPCFPKFSYINNMNFYLIFFITSIILLSGCSHHDDSMRDVYRKHIDELIKDEKYMEVLEDCKKVDLCKVEMPDMLRAYVIASVETKSDHKFGNEFKQCPSYIRNYAIGYYEMLRGKPDIAIMLFEGMEVNMDYIYWPTIAILEYSLYTGDYTRYKKYLDILKGEIEYSDASRKRLVEELSVQYKYYYGFYLLNIGEFQKVGELVAPGDNSVMGFDMSKLKIEYYLQTDEFEKADELINNILQRYPLNQEGYSYKAYLIYLTKGEEGWVAYLKDTFNKHPSMWYIEFLYGDGLMRTGHAKDGYGIMKKIAMSRPYDVFINIYFVDSALAYYYENADADLISSIMNNKYNVSLPFYHYIKAKLQYQQKNINTMNFEIATGRYFNPNDFDLLRIEFDFLYGAGSYKNAEVILDKMYKLDPMDIDILYKKYKLAVLFKNIRDANEISNKILKSKRYVPSDYLKEIRSKDF